ncbi:lysosomal Pro-X carboxypeptidase [Caerostris darwini]|uniref:Lysosomal Pro-X carboxypeptidase n=1 Tax=Caerostris darwini TaxID=1538125 RepID=A0AAV4WN81_9ARAC|nr:lysosomal Pro-X carboxypeptidase [Caerostris darwini]
MARLLIILLSVLTLAYIGEGFQYEEYYFRQKVDHFGYANQDYYQQRYLANFTWYNPKNGAIFFYTGNEGGIEGFANNTGFMWEIAPQYNAAVIFAEHRYYGKSLPYGNLSFTNNTYRGYLSSEQALADFATLIYHLQNKLPGGQKAPVIAFGGSYGGMLAAWIRIKYPHLVKGALASSAPILLFTNEASCKSYSAITTADFVRPGISCAKSIKRSWDVIRKFGKSKSGIQFLTETFKPCQLINSTNIDTLIDWLSGTWGYLAMTDYPYAANFLNPLPAYPINVTCQFLLNESVNDEELVINIAKAANVFHNYTGNEKCNNLVEGTDAVVEEQWNYQTCTELAAPFCSTGITDMFEPQPWNFTEFSEFCWKSFNVRPIKNEVNILYGGKNIGSSNIIFTNGKLDPWYGGGILNSLSDTLIAIFMEDAAHHLDLRSSNPADPVSVKKARRTIKYWISKWISQ